MKNLLLFTLLANLANSTAQNLEPNILIKGQIVSDVYEFEGKVTDSSLAMLLNKLKSLSQDTAMCFISLGEYNNCEDGKTDVYEKLKRYMDDLLDKEISVELTKWNRPWEDENFYSLSFKISYTNEIENYPVDVNFDTLLLDVNEDKINNIVYAREWIDLSLFGQ